MIGIWSTRWLLFQVMSNIPKSWDSDTNPCSMDPWQWLGPCASEPAHGENTVQWVAPVNIPVINMASPGRASFGRTFHPNTNSRLMLFDEYLLLKRQWRWFENLGMPLLETKQPAGGKSWVSQQWAVIIIIRSWGKNGCPNMRRYTSLSNGIETWTNAIHQVLDNEMGFLCFLNKGYRPTFVVPSNRPLGVVWVWLHGPRQGVMSCSSPCWASHVAPPPERPIRVNQSARWYGTTKNSTELTFTNVKNV